MAERKMPSPEDYPSAAIGATNKPKSDVPVTVEKRRSFLKEAKKEVFSESFSDVWADVVYDIIIPTLRDLIADIGHGALDMAMGTSGRYRRGRSRRDDTTYIAYDRISKERRRRSRWDDDDDDRYDYWGDRRRNNDRRVPSNEDLDDWVFKGPNAKQKARRILMDMQDRIDKYDDVSVAYYLDQIGQSIPGDSVSDNWGWYNLDSATIKPAYGGGYRIIFPKMRPIR